MCCPVVDRYLPLHAIKQIMFNSVKVVFNPTMTKFHNTSPYTLLREGGANVYIIFVCLPYIRIVCFYFKNITYFFPYKVTTKKS